jgi:hypothetical protein
VASSDNSLRAETNVRICRSCGGQFELTPETRAWFEQRLLTPPVRCKPCRERRRLAQLGIGDGH